MEKQIAEQQAGVDEVWQQLDPGLRELAATNAAGANQEVLRNLHATFSEALLRYLAASNQLALFPANDAATGEAVERLKSRAGKARAEMIAAGNATTNETHRLELLTRYQAARRELEELNQHFAPVNQRVKELRSELHSQSQPPASVLEAAEVPASPDPNRASHQSWMLPSAGFTLLLGVGLVIAGRGTKKAAA
jgi:hypothetical protein